MKRENAAWYVLIGKQEYGPYKYKKIIQMLQSNQLMDCNYVRASHLTDWTPIYQLEEFSRDHLQFLMRKDPEYATVFIERRQKRIEVKIPVVGHNRHRFFEGEIVSLSEGGGLCLLNSDVLQVGDSVKLQIQGEVPFNLEGEILRKSIAQSPAGAEASDIYYAIKFQSIPEIGIQQIKKHLLAA